MTAKQIAEYQKSACDVRSIEGMIATHLEIWLALNSFWFLLIFEIWKEPWWGILLAVFAFVMNLGTNFSVAKLTLSREKHILIRDTLRAELKRCDEELERILKNAEDYIDVIEKKELYVRLFARCSPALRWIYQIIGLVLLDFWMGYFFYPLVLLFEPHFEPYITI